MTARFNLSKVFHMLLGVGTAILPLSSANAECVCGSIPEPIVALKQANTAFIGTVKRVRKSPVKEGYNEVMFSIMQRLKGFQELGVEEVFVFTPISTDNCGYEFSEGQDYVVFAQGNPAGLRTTPCQGTIYLDNATSHIDALLKAAESEPR